MFFVLLILVPRPSSLVPRPFKCLPTKKAPFPEPFRFSGKAILLHRIHNSLEGCRVIHGEIGEGLAVDLKSFGVDFSHEFGIAHSVFAGAGVDTLDPKGAEVALLGAAVTVSVAEALLDGVTGDGPNISSRSEITFGEFEDFLSAVARGNVVN